MAANKPTTNNNKNVNTNTTTPQSKRNITKVPVPTYKPITVPDFIAGRSDDTTYDSCREAWNDMTFVFFLLYGDWYGNHGSNTSVY
jgi:hypothetical protein